MLPSSLPCPCLIQAGRTWAGSTWAWGLPFVAVQGKGPTWGRPYLGPYGAKVMQGQTKAQPGFPICPGPWATLSVFFGLTMSLTRAGLTMGKWCVRQRRPLCLSILSLPLSSWSRC